MERLLPIPQGERAHLRKAPTFNLKEQLRSSCNLAKGECKMKETFSLEHEGQSVQESAMECDANVAISVDIGLSAYEAQEVDKP